MRLFFKRGFPVRDSTLGARFGLVNACLLLVLHSTGLGLSFAAASGQENDPIFLEVARAVGLDFSHNNGMSGRYYLPEITGSGVALFDYDNDGDLDIYFVQSGLLAGERRADSSRADPSFATTDRLYRNDLTINEDGRPVLRFTDVTAASGIKEDGYGMGVATGDFNNDGWTDLYVTNLGSNRMLLNKGDGTFADITSEAGTDDLRWSTSAAFFDMNRDGWLDLYVANYVDFSVETHQVCYAANSATDYCGPDAYQAEGDSLFLNRGDGTFQDITSQSRVYSERGAGLGVVTADFNGDGWLDVYVANDGDPNLLWLNQKDGTLLNDALMAGVALNGMGSAEASMGVDAGDFDEDGDLDLFMTHIMEETNTLYQNDGKGLFEDRTIEIQLAVASLRRTAFGTAWVDFENDGWLDLIVLNGAVRVIEELARRGDPYPLHQPNQLFRNEGQGTFSEISTRGGPAFETSDVSRGVASGDIDNDGDMDLVVLNNQAPAQLLLNRAGNRNRWIGLRLLGSSMNRDMLGTTVEVLTGKGQSRHRRSRTDGSYCSASDPRVLIGLGDAPSVSEVRVVWPDGEVNVWEGLSVNRYYTLRQGDSPNLEVGPGAGLEAVADTIISGSSIPDDRARPDEILPLKRQRDPVAAGRQISPLREGLLPLILPQIDSLEPVVRDQLRALEEQLRELGEKEDVTSRELALAYGQAGETYHAYELFSAAEACYVNASQLDSSNFRWSYMRGLLYHAAGRLDETLAQYSQARAMRTDYSAVLVNMGDVYLQKNEVELAQRAFQMALDSGSNSPAARYGLGRVALRQQRYSEAAELLQSTLQSVPQANRIHHSLAMAYRGLGDMQKASEHFSRMGPIGLRPVDPLFDHLREQLRGERSHLLRGRKAFAASDFGAAAEEFGKAVQAAPSSVRARLNLAVALAKIGDESRAVQEFREVLKSDSANPTAHFNLGAIRARSGDHQAAVQHFREVVQMNSRDAEAHYLLGKSSKNLGRSAEALTGYRAAIESNPNHEDALLEEAGLLVTESRYGLAVQRLEEAYQRLPHQGRIAHSLARILAACPDRDLRNGSRALDLALRVYEARPTVVHAETVALALAELDRCDEALEWQEGAIRGLRNAGQVQRAQELESMLESYRRGAPCRP